jgi:hypothetical protein
LFFGGEGDIFALKFRKPFGRARRHLVPECLVISYVRTVAWSPDGKFSSCRTHFVEVFA